MSTIYLAHIKAWDPLAGAEVTLRFADAPFVTGQIIAVDGGRSVVL